MIDGFSGWIRAIAGAAVLCGGAMAITPAGKVKNVLKVLCGVVLIIALVEPFVNLEATDLSIDLARYRAEAGAIADGAEKEQTNLSRTIIEEKLNSYILDKAQTLGIEDLSTGIVLKWGDEGFWYPYEIRLVSNAGQGEQKALSSYIEGELGIPASRQYWSSHEDEGAQDED